MPFSVEQELGDEALGALGGAPGAAPVAVGRRIWEHTGHGWSPVFFEAGASWRSVAMVSADEGWAFGARGTVARRTDGGWASTQVVASPAPFVKGIAWPGAAWASAAGSEIWRWDGTAWAIWEPERLKDRVTGPMWGAAPDDVWLAAPRKARGAPPELLHWDGSGFSLHPLGSASGLITSVHGRAADDVWAVGYENRALGKRPLVAHWDGRSWTAIETGIRGSVGQVAAADRVWLLAGGRVWVGGLEGWAEVDVGERQVHGVYAAPGGPVRLAADRNTVLVSER